MKDGARAVLDNFLATVPLPEWKNGDFRNARDRNGNQIVIYDPLTTRANPNGSGYIRDAFPNNVIPADRIHPISRNVMSYWPDPNRPGEGPSQVNNYFRSGKNVNNIDGWFTRIDHVFSDKHRLSGRFGGSQNESFSAGLVEPAFPGDHNQFESQSQCRHYLHLHFHSEPAR